MRVGPLIALRRARPAGWATLLVCASGALILPALHVLEHLHEQEEDAAAALEAPHGHGAHTPHHTHTHDPDGSRHEGDDDDDDDGPLPEHGRGALSHLGVLLAPTATFVFLPAHAVRSALAVTPLRTRAIVCAFLPTRSPRGPPALSNASHT
jgi:hypothetical protein